MFDQLSDRLGAIFSRLSGRGRISETQLSEALREVRVALLEADVSLDAARAFAARVKEKAIGADVLASLTPQQTILRIVHNELAALLGPADPSAARLRFGDTTPAVIALVGLQGSGKTTQAAKLALRLKEQGRRSLLVAADVHRPAAIDQLQTLGTQIGIPVFERPDSDAPAIARAAIEEARRLGLSTVIIDTAGRLQIDEPMMLELERLKEVARPTEVLLVADAMTGQEAVHIAKAFHERLTLTGVILTKLDGDTRGGAALSIFNATGAPIKLVGVGERVSALEPFHADRMASRILGMGDVMTLIEKTQSLYSAEESKRVEQKLLRNAFTLDDFLEQLRNVRKMGSIGDLLKMLPGVGNLPKDVKIPEGELQRAEAIICSMTRRERRDPSVLNGSRRKRIALGSGAQVSDVNRLVRQFDETRKMMKLMKNKGRW